ncbi:unnamed protein product [Scytosiphon promiscuus]
MSGYDDVAMDFGDDDDGDDFLTGKLAALGIDEDLELSGGEEENEDPSPSPSTAPTPAPATATSPKPASDPTSTVSPPRPSAPKTAASTASADVEDWGAAPQAAPGENGTWGQPSESPAAGGRGGRALEDGELLGMIEKPLKASRGRPQQQQERHRQGAARDIGKSGRGGGGRKGGGGGSEGKAGRPKNNGRAHGRNLTIKECAEWMCERLGEPKYYLMCRVVATIGYKKTSALLEAVQQTQDAGGMPTADGSRKRTAGGVFFTLLKQHMEPAKLKELYADEIRVKKEKERARRSENKRKAAAALAGEDVMTPRDPPRSRRRGIDNGDGASTRAGRDMGTWASPSGGVGGGDLCR